MFIHSRVGSVRVSKTFTALSPGVSLPVGFKLKHAKGLNADCGLVV